MTTEKKKSLRDVSELAGVSIATASRVLSGSPLPALSTRRRVRLAAESIGYVPEPGLRDVAREPSDLRRAGVNIGFILQFLTGDQILTDPYYGRMYFSVEEEARRQKRHVNIRKIPSVDDNSLPDLAADMFVGGAIAVSTWEKDSIERVRAIMPLVLLNSAPDGVEVSSVMPDETSGITQALDYLRKLGHRKIFFFMIDHAAPELYSNHHNVRRQSFLNYVERHREDMPEARCESLHGGQEMRGLVRDVLKRWKEADDLPSALLCAADSYALAFIDAAYSLDIKIPAQMSLIGTDDTISCEFVRPRLTSIRQPLELMGKGAARMLMQEMTTGETPIVKRLFDVELVRRESCAPPPATRETA